MKMRIVSTVLALAAAAAAIAAGQNRIAESFEVASVKSNPAPASGALRGRNIICQGIDGTVGRPAFASAGPAAAASDPIPLGRCRAGNVTLLTLVATAYDVSERDVSGGPVWAGSDGFQIEAKAENAGTATKAELRGMLRILVSDRFRLRIRREQKDVEGFVLLQQSNSLKLKQAAPGDPPLHTELSGPRGQQSVVLLGKSSVSDFAAVLASLPFTAGLIGSRPLLDRTELSGMYSFSLTLNLIAGGGGPPELDPALPVALQEQLGLRMESRRVPVDAIVIDHAEKPAEN